MEKTQKIEMKRGLGPGRTYVAGLALEEGRILFYVCRSGYMGKLVMITEHVRISSSYF